MLGGGLWALPSLLLLLLVGCCCVGDGVAAAAPITQWHYTGLSSTYVKQPAPGKSFTWEEMGYLIPHEAIRMMLFDVRGALVHLDGAAWKTNVFCEWYAEFETVLHHHHEAEEEILFPWLATKVPMPESMTSSHKEMVERMNLIESTCAARGQEAAGEIRRQWGELVDMMIPHLEEEERDFIPGFSKFEEAEFNAKVDEIVQSLGMDGNSKFLPAIIAAIRKWGGPTVEAHFNSLVPGPIMWLNNNLWQGDYDVRWARLRSIATDTELPAPAVPWTIKLAVAVVLIFAFVFLGLRSLLCRGSPSSKSKKA